MDSFDPRSPSGPHVEFLAPGVDIETASRGGGRSTALGTGTSFAAPQVAGIAATFMSWLGLTDGNVRPYLALNAVKSACDNVPVGQVNRLVNTGIRNPIKKADKPFRGASSRPAPKNRKCPNV